MLLLIVSYTTMLPMCPSSGGQSSLGTELTLYSNPEQKEKLSVLPSLSTEDTASLICIGQGVFLYTQDYHPALTAAAFTIPVCIKTYGAFTKTLKNMRFAYHDDYDN